MAQPWWSGLLVGAWLFASAFLWPHAPGEHVHTWALGLAAMAIATAALFDRRVAGLLAVTGVWLFAVTVALPAAQAATLWHNLLVGLGLFLLGQLPPAPLPGAPLPLEPRRAWERGWEG